MTRALRPTPPPLAWAPPGIPGLLVIDRTDDAAACETLRATLAPVVAHAQCEPVKPRAK